MITDLRTLRADSEKELGRALARVLMHEFESRFGYWYVLRLGHGADGVRISEVFETLDGQIASDYFYSEERSTLPTIVVRPPHRRPENRRFEIMVYGETCLYFFDVSKHEISNEYFSPHSPIPGHKRLLEIMTIEEIHAGWGEIEGELTSSLKKAV